MSDLRNYSKQFMEEFIEEYRSLPCLRKIKSKEYTNRNLRNQAHKILINKIKEI